MTVADVKAVEVALAWRGPDGRHLDRHWLSPGQAALLAASPHGRAACEAGGEGVRLPPGQLVPGFDGKLVHRLPRTRFKTAPRPGMHIVPGIGRFYPARFLHGGLPSISDGRKPFRITALDANELCVDANHPLATYEIELAIRSAAGGEDATQQSAAGDPLQALTGNGPGMQARRSEQEPDFFSNDPFVREDRRADGEFYRAPRLVQHLDGRARDTIRSLYGRFLAPGTVVLDLMSSWVSHLPDNPVDISVAGLGLNQTELDRNPRLGERRVHDLNRQPMLPWPAERFDLAVCTVSVEYLVSPVEVFREVARVLKPGGHFVVTFSDRWFPTKAVRIWTQLHPFERMSLVLSYFRRSGRFSALSTESWRGWPRPADDPYTGQLDSSDPVFAVWGRRV